MDCYLTALRGRGSYRASSFVTFDQGKLPTTEFGTNTAALQAVSELESLFLLAERGPNRIVLETCYPHSPAPPTSHSAQPFQDAWGILCDLPG